MHDRWRITLPVTVGLLDFRSSDVIDLSLPRGIGSVSLVPGLELDFPMTPAWTLTQFMRAGYTRTSGQAADAVVGALGLRSALSGRWGLYLAEVNYAVADLRGPLPGDSFLRLRNAFRRWLPTGFDAGGRTLRVAPYLVVDFYADPPTSPVTGRDAPRLQRELGVSFALEPRPAAFGIPLPSIGLSYRSAGDLSGWRLAIGESF